MITRRCVLALAVSSAVVTCGALGSAQSLGDVAKKEAERRGAAPQGRTVYTNGDLTPDFTVPTPPPAPEPAAAGAKEAAPSSDSPAAQGEAAPAQQAPEPTGPLSSKGEDYWRDKSARIRSRIDRQRSQIDALQGRANQLRSSNDPGVEKERTLTIKALEKARTDLGYLEDERSNFEATAKAQRIPEAWIR